LTYNRNYTDRQTDSANAKLALLARFKARPGTDDPLMQQRRAERLAVAEARAAREQARLEAKREAERLLAAAAAEREAQERLAELAREEERLADLARAEAERPRKVLLEAVHYAQLRGAGSRRR
jgi:membrane protein involved in colicin uptake